MFIALASALLMPRRSCYCYATSDRQGELERRGRYRAHQFSRLRKARALIVPDSCDSQASACVCVYICAAGHKIEISYTLVALRKLGQTRECKYLLLLRVVVVVYERLFEQQRRRRRFAHVFANSKVPFTCKQLVDIRCSTVSRARAHKQHSRCCCCRCN